MIPYCSVVIPTFNRSEMLLRVLDALAGQQEAPSFEVIVVDDGSSDDTATVVERWITTGPASFPIRLESQENAGPGAARNRGVQLSRGRTVVFLGDDTVPEPRFLAEHAHVHREAGEDPLLACVGYTGWPGDGRVTAFMDYINDYGLQFGYRLIDDGDIVPFNFFYTSNLSVDRELLANHPFDTSFPAAAWEDIELAYRLQRQGLRIHYHAAAVTRHYHPITIDSFARRQYTAGRSGAIFVQKHPELRHFLGVQELEDRRLASGGSLRCLHLLARVGELFRPAARPAVFERLMREHYLRGLRDGLRQIETRIE